MAACDLNHLSTNLVARPAWSESAGALYHVAVGGNERKAVSREGLGVSSQARSFEGTLSGLPRAALRGPQPSLRRRRRIRSALIVSDTATSGRGLQLALLSTIQLTPASRTIKVVMPHPPSAGTGVGGACA